MPQGLAPGARDNGPAANVAAAQGTGINERETPIMTKAFTRLRAVALASALILGSAVSAQAEQVLHRGNAAEPGTLDPHKASGTWENNILGDLFLGLTTEAADGSIIPGAAESWTVSDDGKTYTFKLRAGATWSDGEPVTADDFVYGLQRILNPAFAAEYAWILYVIENAEAVNNGTEPDVTKIGARAVDANTLEIKLAAPAPYFIAQLTHYTAFPVPQHSIEKLGDDWLKAGNMVSNGAYTLAEWVPNSHIRAVKNPNFYDAANVQIDSVYYYPTEDQEAALQRFRAGELDTVDDFASESIDLLRKELPDETRISPYLGIYYYVFNTKQDAFNDVRVRQALSLAINREAITDQVLKTGEIAAYSFVPPGTENYAGPSYVSWKDTPYAERVEQAKALLAEAGYGPDKPLKFQLRYNTSANHERIAIAAQAMWKSIGVEAELFNSETAVHYNDLEAGIFDVARAAWIADYNDAQTFLGLLETRAGAQNYGRYSNAEYDALMEKASGLADLEERGQLMAEAEAIAMEEQPVAPIYYYVSKDLVSKRVDGWVDNVFNIHRSRWISLTN